MRRPFLCKSLRRKRVAPESLEEPRVFLSTSSPGNGDRRLALAVVLVSAALFAALAPFAQVSLPQVPAFLPLYQSALVFNDLVTAALLFGQFRFLRSRGLAVLACGYLFTALVAIAHMLTFPGLLSPGGLLGAGPQSTAWLYVFWHAGFPALVIAYAFLEGRAEPAGGGTAPTVLAGCGLAMVAALGFTALATAGQDLLPAIMAGHSYTSTMVFVVSTTWVLSLLALAALWRKRPHSLLDVWLMVVMCAWTFDIALSAALNAGGYDLGWYAGRAYGLLASGFVLAALLLENGALYAKVAQEARQRLDGIIDSAMDAIITVDEKQDIVLFNATAESVFGCSRSEALGAPLAQFIPERFRRGHPAHIEAFGRTEAGSRRMSAQRVVTGVRRNGEEFPIDASISQATLHGRRFYTVILRDVTERVRAEEALRRSKDELHEMAVAAATAREQEKTRIARELHDELGQSLAALKMDFSWLREHGHSGNPSYSPKVRSMEKILAGMVASTRRISSDLRPLMLDDLGLVPAAEWLVENFREHHGIGCVLAVDPPGFDLDDPHATAVYRILQESLTNIAKHAGASSVDISLACADGHVIVRVRDDGRGFDTADRRKHGSFGLLGLRERAYLVDGRVAVDSAPGRGTTIEVRIPLPEAAG